MREIRLKRTLQEVNDKYVYVSSEDNLYVRDNDEYLVKRYFSPKEVMAILELDNQDQVYKLCHQFNAQQKKTRKKIFVTFTQLKQMMDERANSKRD